MKTSVGLLSGPALFIVCFIPIFFTPVAAIACAIASGADVACQTSADPGTVRPINNQFRHAGNPVDVVSGAKQQRELDFQAAGSALHLSRYYYSGRSDVNNGIGAGWRHSYHVSLYAVNTHWLRIQQASGRWVDFFRADTSLSQTVYAADSIENGYILYGEKPVWYLPDGRALHFSGSYLTQINYPNSYQLHLHYKNGQLQSVVDQDGSTLGFNYIRSTDVLPEYDAFQVGLLPGFLSHVQLPSGELVRYSYDHFGNLVEVLYADAEKKSYRYGWAGLPSHLTAIHARDKGENITRRWHYDEQGRVVRYEAPERQHSLSIVYDEALTPDGLGETQVHFDSGKLNRYQWRSGGATQPSELFGVIMRDCSECTAREFTPARAKEQTLENVLREVRARAEIPNNANPDTVNHDNATQGNATQGKATANSMCQSMGSITSFTLNSIVLDK